MNALTTQVPALDKTLRICDYLGAVGQASFSQIHQALDLPKSSTHTLLAALVAHGLLRQDHDGKYWLGLRWYELGNQAVAGFDIKREAMPILYELRDKTHLTCHLGVLQEREAIYLAKLESQQSIIVKSWEGRRVKLHCSALGKALLAWKSDAELELIFPDEALPVYTPTTPATRTELKRQLAETRARGWSIDNGEDLAEVRCLAAPVRDARGEVMAAVSVSGVGFQIPDSRLEELAILVRAAGIALSRVLGFHGPADFG